METPRCDLCQTELGSKGGTLVAGITLCDLCREGIFHDRLRGRGFRFQRATYRRQFRGKFERSRTITRTTGAVPYRLSGRTVFKKENRLLPPLLRLLGRRDLEMGDALIDESARIETGAPEEARALCKVKGVPGAVLDLLVDT